MTDFHPGDRIFRARAPNGPEREYVVLGRTKAGKLRYRGVNPSTGVQTAWWTPQNLPPHTRWETKIGHRARTVMKKTQPPPGTGFGSINGYVALMNVDGTELTRSGVTTFRVGEKITVEIRV